MRKAQVKRKTKETDITVRLGVDGKGSAKIDTGVGFFDHMLELFAKHGLFDLAVKAKGDLKVDEHHTVEDVGIALGEAFSKALGNRAGIFRYGDASIPMDESLALCAVDLGGRGYSKVKVKFKEYDVKDTRTEVIPEFFQAFAMNAKANVQMKVYGENDHHKAEAMFKAFARAMRFACEKDKRAKGKLPTTKGKI